MASLNEIVYNIKNLAYAGTSNTEQDVSNRQIKFWVHYHRAQILKELSRDGKGTPSMFLQNYNMNWHMDAGIGDLGPDGPTQSSFNEDWQTYLETYANSNQSIVMSDRSLDQAGLDSNSIYAHEDFYGRDFYDMHTHEEKADLGYIRFYIPTLLNINGYGISGLSIRKADTDPGHDVDTKYVPVLSHHEWKNKKYSRFSNKNANAFITHVSNGSHRLQIGLLKSHYRNVHTGYGNPIGYRVYADVLLSNPTDFPGWNDDMQYPISDEMISELIKRVLALEMNITMNARADKITDNADTTKIVQPQAQR